MVEIRKSIPVSEAIERVMKKVKVGATERVSLLEVQGRYLGEDLSADHDVPLFDRSMVDGFAIRAADTSEDGRTVKLKVIEAIGAGYVAKENVHSGETVRVMTGAPIPAGADAVVMLEDVVEIKEESGTYIELSRRLQQEDNIGKKGEDMKKGTILVPAGHRIGAGDMALLATFGYDEVNVYKRPLVGIIATGSELVDVNEPLAPGKIRNSNSYMLQAQLHQLGAIPKYYGILADDFEKSYIAVKSALDEVDYLITTGGVSVGDFDFIPAIIEKLEADVLFNKVEMRPGSVTTVAYKEGKWVFGLSGNPSACFVGLELFVRPILKTYMGSSYPHLRTICAELTVDLGRRNEFARFVRAKVTTDEGKCYVTPVGLERSGIVSSLAEANALLYVPPKTELLKQGELVDVLCFQTVEGYFER